MPVLDDGFVLPESEVIMEYLEELIPEPPLLPADLAERARGAARSCHRFDDLLGDDYYAFRRGDDNDLAERLEALPVGREPVQRHRLRAVGDPRARHARRRPARHGSRRGSTALAQRPSVAAEVEVVRSL